MKLFVGNLPHSLSEADLKDLFAQFGEVASVKIIIDHITKRPKGFGFVEFTSRDDGQKAMNEMNGKEVVGRPLVVNEARPPVKREGGSGGPRRDRDFGNRPPRQQQWR